MPREEKQNPIILKLGGDRREPRREEFLGGRLQVASRHGVRGPDRALLESLGQDFSGKILVIGGREGMPALALGRLFPDSRVHLFQMDAYEIERARATARANGAGNVSFRLAADLPDPGTFDWVLAPVSFTGEAALTCELLREAHAALKPGGKILAGTDNRNDRWLRGQIDEVFGSVTMLPQIASGAAYLARKAPRGRLRERDYRRVFGARLFGREIELETRPGIFSHGELDEGTLALSEKAALSESSRVLDLGCGSGAIGLAAALACPRGIALLADSNIRAVQSARANAARNAASNALAILSPDLEAARGESFDVVLANPPYFADYRIAEHFARQAHRLLAPGGELLLVTKSPERPGEILAALFGGFEPEERRGYTVLRARKGLRAR